MQFVTVPQVLKLSEVLQLTKLSHASLYRLAKQDDRLKPFKLAVRASGWEAEGISAWLEERIAAKPVDAVHATRAAQLTEMAKRAAKVTQ